MLCFIIHQFTLLAFQVFNLLVLYKQHSKILQTCNSHDLIHKHSERSLTRLFPHGQLPTDHAPLLCALAATSGTVPLVTGEPPGAGHRPLCVGRGTPGRHGWLSTPSQCPVRQHHTECNIRQTKQVAHYLNAHVGKKQKADLKLILKL